MAKHLEVQEKPDPMSEEYASRKARPSYYARKCALQAYHTERLVFQTHTESLEILAEKETKWEDEHATVLRGLGYTSARKALATVWDGLPFLERHDAEDDGPRCAHLRGRVTKNVKFSKDVVERPTRHGHCFERSHWRYTAGTWAAPEGQPWLDTSFWRAAMYGTPEYDEQLDEAWEGVECVFSDDDEARCKEIEENGMLVLAWLEMSGRESPKGAFNNLSARG